MSWRSPALVADGQHLVTDVITSVGVIVGLTLALLTGWHFLDPLLAAIVALQHPLDGLQDRDAVDVAPSGSGGQSRDRRPHSRRHRDRTAIGALEAHDIRTRQAGRALFIEFHLVVPGSMTVDEAHVICDRLENSIERTIEGSEVVIHVEPEYKAKPEESGAVPL